MDGPVNGDIFLAYVETQLVPALKRGDIVILDNPGCCKTRAVRSAIRRACAHLLFLPPCGPDLNAIEQVFAKLKHFIRKRRPRIGDELCKTAGATLDEFKPGECLNYFMGSGYAAVQPT